MLITRLVCMAWKFTTPEQLVSPSNFRSCITILSFFDHWSVHLVQSNQSVQAIEFVDGPVPEKLDIFRIYNFLTFLPKLSGAHTRKKKRKKETIAFLVSQLKQARLIISRFIYCIRHSYDLKNYADYGGCYLSRAKTEAHNTLFDLHNSSDQ